jgi:hypothetical protein
VEREEREERPLPPCAEPDHSTVVPHLERPENPNLHAPPIDWQNAAGTFSITAALPKMGAE